MGGIKDQKLVVYDIAIPTLPMLPSFSQHPVETDLGVTVGEAFETSSDISAPRQQTDRHHKASPNSIACGRWAC